MKVPKEYHPLLPPRNGRCPPVPAPPLTFHFLDRCKYGIYAVTAGRLKDSTIEAVRVVISRAAKPSKLIKIEPYHAATKKPVGTRMGKGKGKIDHYFARVSTGRMVFEFDCDNEIAAREAFRQATQKLPIKTHFRIKPPEQKELWTKFE